ncbi:acetoin dehydrogenase E2 subunit dihydrolipoyllysine-residue acetyltransferase [Nocardia otitidiscaviarum]|uniref:Acetoin dehydrogenase E2 subunit dihydrolipoyllysine-residue acetyltransferase n=1 Tax=Nocardia otitidiscaviarum TaxID=1823 RepID=A0A378YLK3_9NOCA|nr:alpha/beta hydrolase [Nocardia otitidiscaviarum]SUA77321.1 acetoin dehydrogenase E2 subunit dihydrolipoyllysine-residue acetyltransferase [Nocardia otitidiscaviarum]
MTRRATTGLSRRGLLGVGAMGIGALAAGCARNEGTAGARARPTIVIVHGANGNGASYAPLLAELTLAGHRALAVDLPGHGAAAHFPPSYQAPQDLAALASEPSPLAELRLADNVAHVVAVVRAAAARGPVILMGHSMGGATITRVGNEVPDSIARLVYLTAFCCVELRSVLECYLTPEAATSLATTMPSVGGDPQRTGFTRTNWRSADPEFLAAAHSSLAEGYDDAAFRAALNAMEPDEAWAVTTDDARGEPATWGRIPRTYIRCTRDRTLPLALQDRMIREADTATPDNPFEVFDLDAPHLGPRDPGPLADILVRLADRLT